MERPKPKNVVEIAIARMPPPHKLGKGAPAEEEGGDADGDGLKAAVKEFAEYLKAGDWDEAAASFRDMQTICSESREG